MKVCTQCNVKKELEEFYRHKHGALGRQSKCKDCIRIYNREWQRNNRDKKRSSTKKYVSSDKYKLAKKRYKKTKAYKAHKVIDNLVQRGVIKKPTCCSFCNKECLTLAHHDDYDKPLDVVWVCSMCHSSIHRGVLS